MKVGHEYLHSIFAFNFNLRRYTMVQGELAALRTYLGSVEAAVPPPPSAPPRHVIPSSGAVIPSWDASRPVTREIAGGRGDGGAGAGLAMPAAALEAAAGLSARALIQVSCDGGVLFAPLVGGAAVAELGGPPLALPPMSTHVRQGLTLVPISAQLEPTLPLSAQRKLTYAPYDPKQKMEMSRKCSS